MAAATASYSYSSEPKAVSSQRTTKAKYRPQDQQSLLYHANLMHDKRVVRGNTYSAAPVLVSQTLSSSTQPAPQVKSTRRIDSAARRRIYSSSTSYSTTGDDHSHHNSSTRLNQTVQTEDYLEELVDQIFEQDSTTQTEVCEDAPLPPVYMAKALGEDKSTCILPGELFEFNIQVEPVLEVIVGKCIDQALIEVIEEEEIKLLKKQREIHTHKRNTLIAETQRLEAQNKRHEEEKDRRVNEERVRLSREQEVARKISARSAAKHIMSNLSNNVTRQLVDQGYLIQPIQRQIQEDFLPWIINTIHRKFNDIQASRECVNDMVLKAISSMQFEVSEKKRIEREAIEAAELAERQRLNAIQIAQQEEIQRKAEEARIQAEKEAAEEALRIAQEEAEANMMDGDADEGQLQDEDDEGEEEDRKDLTEDENQDVGSEEDV